MGSDSGPTRAELAEALRATDLTNALPEAALADRPCWCPADHWLQNGHTEACLRNRTLLARYDADAAKVEATKERIRKRLTEMTYADAGGMAAAFKSLSEASGDDPLLDAFNRERARAEAAEARVAALEGALRACAEYLPESEGQSYGSGSGVESPHDFHPDEESSTEAERAAHKAACDAFDRGEPWDAVPACSMKGGIILSHQQWGLGTYTYRDADVAAAHEAVRAALAVPAAPKEESKL